MTEWLPLKKSPARSSSATIAAALEALSITGNSDETKEPTAGAEGPAAAGESSPSQAWEGPDATPEVEGLWRPSLKVAGGASGESRPNTLSEAGILAKQGSLQPLGKVVFILENNHRVSDRVFLRSLTALPRAVAVDALSSCLYCCRNYLCLHRN